MIPINLSISVLQEGRKHRFLPEMSESSNHKGEGTHQVNKAVWYTVDDMNPTKMKDDVKTIFANRKAIDTINKQNEFQRHDGQILRKDQKADHR